MPASSFVGQLTHNSSGMSSSMWILDYCAFHHMSLDSSCLASMSLSSSIPVMTDDGTPMALEGVGYVVTSNLSLFLSHVYHIPKLALNPSYVGQLCDSSNLVTFSSYCCYLQNLQS